MSLLPTPKPQADALQPPKLVEPDERALLASALAALFAPRAAGQLLIAPYQWAERENLKRARQYESELNRQLRLAQIDAERLKAQTPIVVEQMRSAERRAEREAEAPKVEAETEKVRAETQRIQADTQRALQRLPLDVSRDITNLLLKAGDEKVGADERREILAYARYLMRQYGVDLSEFLPQEVQASPAQARAAAQAVGELAQAEQATASAERQREEAETERQERPLKLEERRARIRLIQAQELTERVQPELMRARIQELRANIAQGWQGLRLRAEGLQLAIRRQNWAEAQDLLEGISKSRAFWEQQARELERSITIEQETESYDPETGKRIRARRRVADPNAPAELRNQAAEARRLADEYRRAEEAMQRRLGKPATRTRQLQVPGVGNVQVEEDI